MRCDRCNKEINLAKCEQQRVCVTWRVLPARCDQCGEEVDLAKCEQRGMKTGSGYNDHYGQEEHWFSGEFKCPSCGEWFYHGDTSL